jgi:hypothetical protein
MNRWFSLPGWVYNYRKDRKPEGTGFNYNFFQPADSGETKKRYCVFFKSNHKWKYAFAEITILIAGLKIFLQGKIPFKISIFSLLLTPHGYKKNPFYN